MSDSVADFYNRHPYPPPVSDLDGYAAAWADGSRRRAEHCLMWPTVPFRDDIAILVAGCGTSQAVKYAMRYPRGNVVGIDVSDTSIETSRALADRYQLENLRLSRATIEEVEAVGESFDYVVCTGVLHHLHDPEVGLAALAEVLAPGGVLNLMLYASFGRLGVEMIQEYCRLMGVGTAPDELDDLIESLRELPIDHPLRPLLGKARDFESTEALADALLNPRERSYTVPQVFDLLERADLAFGRWIRQAAYLPSCGLLATVPHGRLAVELPELEQYAVAELYRGTMTRHSFVAHRREDSPRLKIGDPTDDACIPVRPHTVVSVEERLPAGASAALLNQAHEFNDLVMFVDDGEKQVFDAIDGVASVGALSQIDSRAPDVVRRFFDHDLVVIDASRVRR